MVDDDESITIVATEHPVTDEQKAGWEMSYCNKHQVYWVLDEGSCPSCEREGTNMIPHDWVKVHVCDDGHVKQCALCRMLAVVHESGTTAAVDYHPAHIRDPQVCRRGDMTEERLATKEKLTTAERRVAELEAENAAIRAGAIASADNALAVQMQSWLARLRVWQDRALTAERARDEALAKLTALEAEARADKALIKRITVICDDCPGEGHCEFCNDAGVVPHDARLQRELEAVVDAFPDDLGDDEPWTPSQGMRAVVAARDEALRRAEAAERVVRLGKAWMEQGPCEEDDRYTAFVDALKSATLDPKVKP